MRRLLFAFTITFICLTVKAQTSYYYYYEGEKQYFTLNTEYAFLSLKENQLPTDIQKRNIKATGLFSDKNKKISFLYKKMF